MSIRRKQVGKVSLGFNFLWAREHHFESLATQGHDGLKESERRTQDVVIFHANSNGFQANLAPELIFQINPARLLPRYSLGAIFFRNNDPCPVESRVCLGGDGRVRRRLTSV